MSYKFYLGSFFLYNLQFVSGDTGIMIFGNRNGKAGKKCSRLGSNEYECNVKKQGKVLLAIPQVQSATSPSLLITETGELVQTSSQ